MTSFTTSNIPPPPDPPLRWSEAIRYEPVDCEWEDVCELSEIGDLSTIPTVHA